MERLYNNINNGMCRCCASEGTFKDLSSKYRWMGVEEVYADMLRECFDVTLTYPEENPEAGICEVCITQLRNAANFKKQVLNTEEQFKKMLQNKTNIVKVEVSPPEDDGVQFTDEDNNLSNDDFSSTEYEVPIKTESEEGKSRKRSAKAGPSRSKQPKMEGESSAKPMLFKVVKCIQGGKFTFAIVPDEWERDGTIQWPRKYKFGKLTLGEILHPGEEWIEIQCVVVKKDIQTYKDAEKVLMKKDPISREKTNDDMRLDRQKDKTPPDLALNNSSNEQDEMNNDPLRLPEDSSGGNSASSLEKDTEQANKALEADNTKETDLVNTSNPHKATSIIPYIVETSGGDTNIIFDLNEDNTDTGDVSLLPFLVSNSTTEADTSKLSDSANYSKIDSKTEHTKENNKINKKLDDLTAKVSTILENQTIMSLNQASLSNMFEKFMRATGCSFAVNEEKKSNLDFDVMQTADDLISFEEKLVDPVFRENMMEKFAIICKRSDGHGTTVAYKLVDLMFAREFLTQCSWSGLSRDDLRKVCFKMFHRTRDFFFKTVRSKDHLFTMEECDNFLKNILKNSKRRNTGLNLRTPSQKRRKRLKKLYTAQLYKDDSESGDGERETVESLIETAMTIEEE